VTFSNLLPRRSANGEIINAHDGTTRRYGPPGSPFYYHSVGYPHCNETGAINGCNSCIYSGKNTLDVWASPDLSSGSWVKTQTVFPNASAGLPACTYFRSQAVFNPATKKYVLWANAVGCAGGEYVVAVSDAPGGPFSFSNFATPANLSSLGDFALLVDDDGAAYAVATHLVHGAGPRDMIVFGLTADFTGFSGVRTDVLPGQKLVEAPAFFKRGDTYFILLGGCTCMGLYGGGVGVLTAPHPLGPWTNISGTLDPGCKMYAQTTCFQMGPGAVCNPVTQAQQNFVMEVPLAGGGTAMVWTGDRWQQSPNKMYDEQPQTWLPLTFDGDAIAPLEWVDAFSLDVAE